MKYAALLLLLAGCSTPPKPFDVSGLEPACTRSCLASHSQCASQASIGTANRVAANDVLLVCRSTADACLSTCR